MGRISDTPTLFHCCRGTWLEGMCGWNIGHPHSVPLLQGHLVGGYVWVVYQTPPLCSIAAGALGWRVCVGGIPEGSAPHLVDHPSLCSRAQANR